MKLSKTLLVTTVAATAATAAVVGSGAASASPTIAGTYNPVGPTRVVDTRSGTGAPKAALGSGKTLTFSTAKALGSATTSAQALTVTAVSPAAAGYLVVYPGGAPRPATSTLNFQAGLTTSNAAIVARGSASTVSVYNASSASVNITVDLSGYWTAGTVSSDTAGAYKSTVNTRIFQTKASKKQLAAGGDVTVPVLGQGGVPSSGVAAVAVNLTAVAPASSGYLNATANATDQQGSAGGPTSDVAFRTGENQAGMTIVPVDPETGSISVHNGATTPLDIIVDTEGYFTDGAQSQDGAFVPATPYRNSDTRTGSAVGAGKTVKLTVIPSDTPSSLFKAVVVGLTETAASKAGYLTAYSGTGARPGTASLAFSPRTSTVSAIVPLGSDGTISVYNGSTSSVQIILDVHGFVLNDLSGTPAQARATIRTALSRAHKAAVTRLAN